MCARSTSSSRLPVLGETVISGASSLSAKWSVGPDDTITARSTTLSNSRTLPGHAYPWSVCNVFLVMLVIGFPSFAR